MWSVNDLDSHANLSHVNLPTPTVLCMLPRDKFIPSSNIDIGPDKGNIIFVSDAFISSIKQNSSSYNENKQLWRVDSMFLRNLGLDYFQKMQVSWVSWWNIWNLRNLPKKPPRDCQSWNTSRWSPEGSTCCRHGNQLPNPARTVVQNWAWRGESVDVLVVRVLEKRWILRKNIQRLGKYEWYWWKTLSFLRKSAVMLKHQNPLILIPESFQRKKLPVAQQSQVTSIWNCSSSCACHVSPIGAAIANERTKFKFKRKTQRAFITLPTSATWSFGEIWLPEILHLLVTQRILDALSLHLIPLGDVFMLHLLRLDGAMTHDLTQKCKKCMCIYINIYIYIYYQLVY